MPTGARATVGWRWRRCPRSRRRWRGRMAEARPPAVSLSVHAPGHVSGEDLRARIDDLHALGAARLDPVGWRVIEAMLRRLDGFDGAARTALARKIERRLATFRERFERASSAASSKRS